jgi:hypothetical protein
MDKPVILSEAKDLLLPRSLLSQEILRPAGLRMTGPAASG